MNEGQMRHLGEDPGCLFLYGRKIEQGIDNLRQNAYNYRWFVVRH